MSDRVTGNFFTLFEAFFYWTIVRAVHVSLRRHKVRPARKPGKLVTTGWIQTAKLAKFSVQNAKPWEGIAKPSTWIDKPCAGRITKPWIRITNLFLS